MHPHLGGFQKMEMKMPKVFEIGFTKDGERHSITVHDDDFLDSDKWSALANHQGIVEGDTFPGTPRPQLRELLEKAGITNVTCTQTQ